MAKQNAVTQTPVPLPPAQAAGTEAAPLPFDPTCLVRVGLGFWTYRHRGDPADIHRQADFFAQAFAHYGMRDDDVICVNAAPMGVGLVSATNG
jgi:hypothetical protein